MRAPGPTHKLTFRLLLLLLSAGSLAAGRPSSPLSALLQQAPASAPGSASGSPAGAVTVVQLDQIVQSLHAMPDAIAARLLARLVLTERLSGDLLSSWESRLPGLKARHALLAVADASAFLRLPPANIPATPPPSPAEQLRIQSLASAYLARTIPKLPDFFAKQLTVRFERAPPKSQQDDRLWRDEGMSIATVMYRHSDEAEAAQSAKGIRGFFTEGVFGPILSMPMQDAGLHLTWDHWERIPSGPLAVFRYEVKEAISHFAVVCQLTPYFFDEFHTGYHAEVAIDPATGAILRLTLMADLNPSLPCRTADVMVEYGPVSIGGKIYTCPLRSVSLSSLAKVNPRISTQLFVPGHDRTQLNDIAFSDYRVFRVTTRILNAGNPQPDNTGPLPR